MPATLITPLHTFLSLQHILITTIFIHSVICYIYITSGLTCHFSDFLHLPFSLSLPTVFLFCESVLSLWPRYLFYTCLSLLFSIHISHHLFILDAVACLVRCIILFPLYSNYFYISLINSHSSVTKWAEAFILAIYATFNIHSSQQTT